MGAVMANINKNEYGQTVRVNFGQDISAATSYNFILEPQIGDKQEKSTAVAGTVNVVVGDETYIADQYIEYTLADGDIDQDGLWRLKGEATISATNKIISDYKTISVLP